MEEKQKPFILEMDEARAEIIQIINKAVQVHKLPCYIVNMILSEIIPSIQEGAKQELIMARQQFEAQQTKDEEVA